MRKTTTYKDKKRDSMVSRHEDSCQSFQGFDTIVGYTKKCKTMDIQEKNNCFAPHLLCGLTLHLEKLGAI